MFISACNEEKLSNLENDLVSAYGENLEEGDHSMLDILATGMASLLEIDEHFLRKPMKKLTIEEMSKFRKAFGEGFMTGTIH